MLWTSHLAERKENDADLGRLPGRFEVRNGHDTIIPGYADLHVHSTLKTHKPGIHLKNDVHGTEDYMRLVNIDGQSLKIPGRLDVVTSPMCDSEQGEGISYQLKTKLRLKSGIYKVVIALPADDLVAEREVFIADGENKALTVEPIYGSIPGKK